MTSTPCVCRRSFYSPSWRTPCATAFRRAYIQVSDCGPGFPEEVLRKLDDPNDPTYTGLFNVRKRLRAIYGDTCEFSIQNGGDGATVAFSIPLIPPRMPDEL